MIQVHCINPDILQRCYCLLCMWPTDSFHVDVIKVNSRVLFTAKYIPSVLCDFMLSGSGEVTIMTSRSFFIRRKHAGRH